jgi:hypothetical protein
MLVVRFIVRLCTYINVFPICTDDEDDSWNPVRASQISPRMPFPEPETALAATIGAGIVEILCPTQNRAPLSFLGPFYEFSMIYTLAQSLTRREPATRGSIVC